MDQGFGGGERTRMLGYVTKQADITDPRQCFLNPDDPTTWKPCGGPGVPDTERVWWDVYPIPSARTKDNQDPPQTLKDSKGQPVVIPGYFKMRSRFVDYPGFYVLHCHILIHEDRGMMFSVEVINPRPTLVRHH
jgi:hypothetical protein